MKELSVAESILRNDLNEIAITVSGVVRKIKSNVGDLVEYEFPDYCIILPLTFHQLIPLRREQWKNPETKTDYGKSIDALNEVLDKRKMLEILVVPMLYSEKRSWVFQANRPFFKNTDVEQIDKYLTSSNTMIDESAKYAAIYNMQKPFKFNWLTEKRLDYNN